MPRPKNSRWVCCEPSVNYFKPRGIPITELERISLAVDELEAIRLKDLQLLEQERAATTMNISQPTFHRILESAYKKVADALVNGKAIRIEGGDYLVREGARLFKCYDCRNEWQEPYGTERPARCPKCNSRNIHRARSDRGRARIGKGTGGRRHGQD
jgi:predicted DNA-binding protein (UPF0251 family)/DNA-directed RNA polymerase subunit RPC12/RpoP